MMLLKERKLDRYEILHERRADNRAGGGLTGTMMCRREEACLNSCI
jgi:hypothetical protein